MGVKSESSVAAEIVKYMHGEGWLAKRNHVGTFLTHYGGHIHVGEQGEPDWLFLRPTASLWVEVKKPSEKPKKHQREYIAKLQHKGFFAVAVDSLDALKEYLANAGFDPHP